MNTVHFMGSSPAANSIAAKERGLVAQDFRLLGHGDSVQIHNAEEVLLLSLPLHPTFNGSQVVA